MDGRLKQIKDKIYWFVAQKNEGINNEFGSYVDENRAFHHELRYERWLLLARLNWHYRVLGKTTPLLQKKSDTNVDVADFDYYTIKEERKTKEELLKILDEYDVVSFDIFNTAIYRKVEKPTDLFAIMALEIGHEDFENLRIRAERIARADKERNYFTREVTLEEIYSVLDNEFGINRKWRIREIELEYELTVPNPFILQIYQELVTRGKQVIFVSDMYLDPDSITLLLEKSGYQGWKKLYVSNIYGKNKGDGSLQRIVSNDYKGMKVIHIGDNLHSDIEMSKAAGMDALYNPSPVPPYREEGMDNLAGSFYRAVVNNAMNNGLWGKTIYYSHGFRVGGILTAMFCCWINGIVKQKGIDKILFCARDCEIIYRAYNQFFMVCKNEYLQISRYAIMSVCPEKYLYDLVHRVVLRSCQEYRETKTIEMILRESGFEYLTEKLDEVDIDKHAFPATIDTRKLEKFILSQLKNIKEHNEPSIEAAKKYFESLISNSKNILIVDVGWSGTCLSAFKYFIENQISDLMSVHGALMCSSNNKPITSNMESGVIDTFVYSPFYNDELKEFMFPKNEIFMRYEDRDRRRMPLEYLFTSCQPSLASYALSDNGKLDFVRNNNEPENKLEIKEMQEGILDFVGQFCEVYGKYLKNADPHLYSHVAFNPLKQAILHSAYCYSVYKNFAYDARVTIWDESEEITRFGTLFSKEPWMKEQNINKKKENDGRKRILFITPELPYTGAPRSVLRMCKVAINLGYDVDVWSAKPGPFVVEYRKYGISVKIVPDGDASSKKIIKAIKSFDMAVCNTIVTEQFARICSRYIPTVWYIREATNVPDFIRNHPQRKYLLRHSKNLYCVSNYAAKALKTFTNHPVKVINNCVEDEAELATPYTVGTSERIRFAQWGTIEHRKGFDVLLSAYEALSPEYQSRSELYFAGRFIKQASSYSALLLNRAKGFPNVHYLGELTGTEKTTKLSEMDVVVVASRDESCSLVLLEGAMLSKPLITTENVGANYIVKDDNGIIVKTGDALNLAEAMKKMIDTRSKLKEMGERSRVYYEELASMESYTTDMKKLYSLCSRKNSLSYFKEYLYARLITSEKVRYLIENIEQKKRRSREEKVIVSLTSHPGRVGIVGKSIRSLLCQTARPEKILLWLSKTQFPDGDKNLPKSLVKLQKDKRFEIRWVNEDLAPHKKYFYVMQEYPDYPVVTVDDDVVYENDMVEKLMESYRKFPKCVSASRANLMTFKENGSLRSYDAWIMEYSFLTNTPSRQLMPTGVGGVLYPPHSLPAEAFNKEAIRETCLFTDDLWLKVWTMYNGFATVVPSEVGWHKVIDEAQNTALWRINVNNNNNDSSMQMILDYFQSIHPEMDWVGFVREQS